MQSEARDHSGSDSCTFTDGDKRNSSVNESANPPPPTLLQPLRHKRNRQHAPRIARRSSKYPAVKYTYFIGFNCLCVCTYLL